MGKRFSLSDEDVYEDMDETYHGYKKERAAYIAQKEDSMPISMWTKQGILDVVKKKYGKATAEKLKDYKKDVLKANCLKLDAVYKVGTFQHECPYYKIDVKGVRALEKGIVLVEPETKVASVYPPAPEGYGIMIVGRNCNNSAMDREMNFQMGIGWVNDNWYHSNQGRCKYWAKHFYMVQWMSEQKYYDILRQWREDESFTEATLAKFVEEKQDPDCKTIEELVTKYNLSEIRVIKLTERGKPKLVIDTHVERKFPDFIKNSDYYAFYINPKCPDCALIIETNFYAND